MTVNRIAVKFIGFPMLRRKLGENRVEVLLDGSTFGDLLRNLEKTYGPVIRENVLNDRGHVAQNVQVLHNDTLWIERDDMKFALRSGDKVIFMLMVAGG